MIEYKLYSEVKGKYEIADGFFEGWLNPPSKVVHKILWKTAIKLWLLLIRKSALL